jgi:hypothetical protein
MAQDQNKPKEPSSLEHPISEAEAKKYAGQGDFNLPVSPLDQLVGGPKPAQVSSIPDKSTSPQVPLGSPQAAINKAAEAVKPAEPPKAPEKPKPPAAEPATAKAAPVNPMGQMQPTKPDTAVPTSPPKPDGQPKPGVNLEATAKDLLKELDKKSPPKKKKRRGGAASKMALAAVLVVMMGAGGMVGINLMKMQQVADQRSQAAAGYCKTSSGFVSSSTCAGSGIAAMWNATTKECCVVSRGESACSPSCNTSTQFCTTHCSSAGGGDHSDDRYTCNQSGCTSHNFPTCYISHYHAPKTSTQQVWVENCHNPPADGDVNVVVCAGSASSFRYDCGKEQIDVVCPGHTDSRSRNYGRDCEPESTPTPIPIPDPDPDPDRNLCDISTPRHITLLPGENLTVTGSAKMPVEYFQVSFYNPDNLKDPNDPRTSIPYKVEVKPGVEPGSNLDHFYVRYRPDEEGKPKTTTHTFNVSRRDLQKPDLNWVDAQGNPRVPQRLTYLFFFQDGDVFSSPNGLCWGEITFALHELACNSLTANTEDQIRAGQTVEFTCNTTPGNRMFMYRYGLGPNVTEWTTSKLLSNTRDRNPFKITFPKPGSYVVQCRNCWGDGGGDCTAWGQAGR